MDDRPEADSDLVAVAIPGVVDELELRRSLRPDEWADLVVLVSTETAYSSAVGLGLSPILIPLRFSLTDRRAEHAARLGGLIMPWRWRRVFLNEGIVLLYVPQIRGTLHICLGAVLSGVKIRTGAPPR